MAIPRNSKRFNLLVLGGGKRVGLVRSFKFAATEAGFDFSCFAYESSHFLPISLEAEIIIGCTWNDPHILDDLSNIIIENNIDWVCACVDQATLLLDELRDILIPNLLTSNEPAYKRVLDKKEANSIAKDAGLKIIPDSHTPPLFVKPIVGAASKGAGVIETFSQLEEFRTKNSKDEYMFQQLCSGAEYTVDCFATPERIYASPRRRIQTVGGEALVTQTVEREDLVEQSEKFIRSSGLLGPLTIQFIEHENDVLFMECNPRFGGGVLCSIEKGFDYPAVCVAIAKNIELPTFSIKSQIMMSRYFSEVYFATDN